MVLTLSKLLIRVVPPFCPIYDVSHHQGQVSSGSYLVQHHFKGHLQSLVARLTHPPLAGEGELTFFHPNSFAIYLL